MADDDRWVEAFESLVQHQQPAKTPWVPVTDYSFDARRAAEGRHPQLILETFKPRAILDAGMGPGHLVRLLRELGAQVAGFDLQRRGDEYGDLAAPSFQGPDHEPSDSIWPLQRFDLVICREVLEHLTVREIYRAVHNLVALSSRYVYVTTRFCQGPAHLLSVETSDDLDPTHITMLTKSFLRLLFILEGCTSCWDLEQRMDWKNLGRCLVLEVPRE